MLQHRRYLIVDIKFECREVTWWSVAQVKHKIQVRPHVVLIVHMQQEALNIHQPYCQVVEAD